MSTFPLTNQSFSTSPLFTTVPTSPFNTSLSDQERLRMAVHTFWSAFPCPPPWRPHLLLKVNASKLEPHVTQTVLSFLAGKCNIAHVFNGDFDLDSHSFPGSLHPYDDTDGRGDLDSDSTLTHAESDGSWCDLGCQMAVGCGVLFVLLAAVVSVLLCFNRNRTASKLTSTRPSRQQLQLSTSVSDHNNVTDFSNLEVQGDDDVVFPPFRQRNLPTPPPACYPCCDPAWNCPACSSMRSLVKCSPSGHYYASRTYSAVYETIDDEEEEAEPRGGDDVTELANENDLRDVTGLNQCCRPGWQSYIPCTVSTVQIRPHDRTDIQFSPLVAETGFNGDDSERDSSWSLPPQPHHPGLTAPLAGLPTYFELEKNHAFAPHPSSTVPTTMNSNPNLRHRPSHSALKPSTTTSNTTEQEIASFSNNLLSPFVTSPCDVATCPFTMPITNSQVLESALPSFSHNPVPPAWLNSTPTHMTFSPNENRPSNNSGTHHVPPQYHNSAFEHNTGNQHTSSSSNGPCLQTFLQWVPSQSPAHSSGGPTAKPLPDRVNNLLCSKCHNVPQPPPPLLPSGHDEFPSDLDNAPFPSPPPALEVQGQGDSPDLLREASCTVDGGETCTGGGEVGEEEDLSLRKPVLALHSHYFNKNASSA